MPHPPLAIIADANFYRGLGDQLLSDLQRLEAVSDVRVHAFPYTLLELLAHTATPADPSYGPAKAALRRVTRHAGRLAPDGSATMSICRDSEQILAQAIFKQEIQRREGWLHSVGSIAFAVAESRDHADLARFQEELDSIAQWVQTTEDEFVRHLWEAIVLPLYPQAQSWKEICLDPVVGTAIRDFAKSPQALANLARGALARTGRALGVASYQPTEEHVAFVVEHFRTGLAFTNVYVTRMLSEGTNMGSKRHRNTCWDEALAFAISAALHLEDRPVVLVSDDRLLHEAAQQAARSDLVLTLAAYEGFLGHSPAA